MVMNAILCLENGSFSYPGRPIFANANVNANPGEVLCILGPNGCGKSTLMDCLLGILPLDRGQVRIRNKDIAQLSQRERARQMAYVPQNHDRHFAFSVIDILVMGRAACTSFYKSPGKMDFQAARAVLDEFGLSRLKDRDYTRLSGGETRMVMIMRALVQDTPLIIMDEPTAHLDFRHELVVLETIARLVREKKRTVIMATHYPNHAFYLENMGVDVQLAFMDQKRIRPNLVPGRDLTEDNIAALYRVEAVVADQQMPGNDSIKQIIPIKTMDRTK